MLLIIIGKLCTIDEIYLKALREEERNNLCYRNANHHYLQIFCFFQISKTEKLMHACLSASKDRCKLAKFPLCTQATKTRHSLARMFSSTQKALFNAFKLHHLCMFTNRHKAVAQKVCGLGNTTANWAQSINLINQMAFLWHMLLTNQTIQ